MRDRRGPGRAALAAAAAAVAATTSGGLAAATAQPALYDWCTGVDHPPFEQAYPGDGASYFLIGASSAQSGPHTLLALLDGEAMELQYDGPGRDAVAFPIYSYGDYAWAIQGPDGTVLQEGTSTVDASEDPCSEDTLSAPPEPEPSTATPTETGSDTIVVPSDAPTIVTTPTEVASEPATDTGGGVPPWIWIGGLLVLVGGGVFLGTRPRTPVTAPPACRCDVEVTIEGPADLAICCMDVEWTLGKVRYQPPDDAEMSVDDKARSDPSKRHLDGDVKDKDGWEYSDHVLAATITAKCTEGASANVADATYDWSLKETDAGLEVTVKVAVPVSCPGAGEAPPAVAETTLTIPFRKAPCVITVLLEQNSWSEKLYNHCDVMITCGEYTEIFGFFPKEAGAGVFVGTPGNVQRWSEADVNVDDHGLTSISDKIGKDLKTYRGSMKTKAWVISPEDCTVCAKMREYWEDLAANAADHSYTLLSNNCVANVWKSLRQAGAIDAKLSGMGTEVTPATGSVLEEGLDAQASSGSGNVAEGVVLE